MWHFYHVTLTKSVGYFFFWITATILVSSFWDCRSFKFFTTKPTWVKYKSFDSNSNVDAVSNYCFPNIFLLWINLEIWKTYIYKQRSAGMCIHSCQTSCFNFDNVKLGLAPIHSLPDYNANSLGFFFLLSHIQPSQNTRIKFQMFSYF